MKVISRICTVFALVLFISCGSDDDGSPAVGGGDDDESPTASATYEVTFTPNFTADTHPTDYPSNAMFGPILAIAHAPDVSVFRLGQAASAAFKGFAEDGDADALATALTTGVDGMEVTTMIFSGGSTGPTSADALSVNVTPTNTRITFVARLSPSPDWFVGVDSFNVVGSDGISLVDSEEFSLSALDAGTDSGPTYDSPNDPTTGGTIRVINDAPFGTGGLTSALGTVKFERSN
jgi:hypothetical protein